MPRRPPAEEGPPLFDLPLDPPPAGGRRPEPDAPAGGAPEAQPELPWTPSAAEDDVVEDEREDGYDGEDARAASAPPAPAAPVAAPAEGKLRRRLIAGLADLGVCAAVIVLLLVVLWANGLRPSADDWPAGALFLLSFSFLYKVLPLAFWGRTPGMALAGLRATTPAGEPLTFGQSVRRWLAAVLTVALAGLPALLALTGRSLADRLSGSITRVQLEPR